MDDLVVKENADSDLYQPINETVPTFQTHPDLMTMQQLYLNNQYFAALQLRSPVGGMVLSDSEGSAGTGGDTMNFNSSKCRLPPWTILDGRVNVSLAVVLNSGLLMDFATDKVGCHFLQENFPTEAEPSLRRSLYEQVLGTDEIFLYLSRDVFGNFIVQKLIESAIDNEVALVAARLDTSAKLIALSQQRYPCRVVQKAIEYLPLYLKDILLMGLQDYAVELAVDQNANHVIQRVLQNCPPSSLVFAQLIDEFIANERTLFAVVENKYGCRVLQVALEVLCLKKGTYDPIDDLPRQEHLDKLIGPLVNYCERFTRNEFANYIIQHILATAELRASSERIMNNCILNNILTLSQDKFASHVVEKALKHASPRFFEAMVEELFEGYIPDEQGRIALDILLFDQYGNYVVQTLLDKLASSVDAMPNLTKALHQLAFYIMERQGRLKRYSSGKKILEQLRIILLQKDCPFDFNANNASRSPRKSISRQI